MYNYVMSLLKFDIFNKGKTKLINNFSNILINCTEIDIMNLFMNKRFISIVIENDFFFKYIEVFSKKLSSSNIVSCIKSLYKEKSEYVLNNKYKLFDYYNDSEFLASYLPFLFSININISDLISYLDTNEKVLDYNTLVKEMIKASGGKQILVKHKDYILNNNENLLQFRQIVAGTDLENIVIEQIDSNPSKVIYEIISKRCSLSKPELEKLNGIDFLRELVEELLKNEEKNYSDIKIVNTSDSTDVYEIGNKILKISNDRKQFSILKSKRLLKPLYRQNIIAGDKFLYSVQITEKTDVASVTPENLYQIYKEFRDQGLIWVNCQMDNLGRLRRANSIYFNGNSKFNQQLEDNSEVLKEGDIVVLSSDYIYPYEEFKKLDIKENKILSNIYRYNALKTLEERYLSEKNSMVYKK